MSRTEEPPLLRVRGLTKRFGDAEVLSGVLVVSQEGGDSDTWTVFLWSVGRLAAARPGSW